MSAALDPGMKLVEKKNLSGRNEADEEMSHVLYAPANMWLVFEQCKTGKILFPSWSRKTEGTYYFIMDKLLAMDKAGL